MNKMTPDQSAARKEFLMFIKTGDDVLREAACKLLTSQLEKNKALKKERALAKKAIAATFTEPVASPKMVTSHQVEESVAPKKRGRKPLTQEQKDLKAAQKESLVPKKRGPKPKMKAAVVENVEAPKKRGRKPKVQAVAVETGKRGPKPQTPEQKAVKAAQKALELATQALNEAKSQKKEVASGRGRKMSISKLRQDLGWTQSQMASALGVNQAIVSQIESGKMKPSDKILEKAKEVKASN